MNLTQITCPYCHSEMQTWIVHNFINEHATTKQVPAVSLGILERGLSWEEVFKIQRAA